jgi:AcrR family transcriptional regulator
MERRSNSERRETTRAVLLAAARALFVEHGFAGTSTPQVAADAGVSRGALYHQFEDKQALFHAVLVAEAQAVAQVVNAAAPQIADARAQLVEGAQAYLRAMRAPGRCRLLLVEGPAVLGVNAMRSMDLENGVGTIMDGLREVVGSRESSFNDDAVPFLAIADILSSAFERAALAIDQGAERRHYELAATTLLLATADSLERR